MSLARAVSRHFAEAQIPAAGAPEDVHAARGLFVRELLERARATGFTLRVLDAEGRRLTLGFNSVRVRAGERLSASSGDMVALG